MALAAHIVLADRSATLGSRKIGQIVEKLREAKGLTQHQLAERAQVSQSFISILEGGKIESISAADDSRAAGAGARRQARGAQRSLLRGRAWPHSHRERRPSWSWTTTARCWGSWAMPCGCMAIPFWGPPIRAKRFAGHASTPDPSTCSCRTW